VVKSILSVPARVSINHNIETMATTGTLRARLYERISQYQDLHDQVVALRRLSESYRKTKSEHLLKLIEMKEEEIDQILVLLDE
jgi:hypothetical protein